MIDLGMTVKDRVSGFKGVATAKVEYLNGCTQFCVVPKLGKDGKKQGGVYFDVGQLEIVSRKRVVKRPAAAAPVGGPSADEPCADNGAMT